MSDQKLKEALQKLKDALQEVEPHDTQSRELINKLISHLEKKSDTSQDTEEHSHLLKAVKEKILSFETTHPVISSTLEEIIGILTRMGI